MPPLWRIGGPGLPHRAAAAQNVAGITACPRNDAGSVRYCCRMPVTTLTDDTFESAVTSAEAAVVVLTDAHCSTCGHYTTVVERVAEQMADEAEFYFVSHDSAPEVYASSGVSSVPTTVIFRQGMLLHLDSGAHTEENLTQLVHVFAEADVEELRQAVQEQGTTVIGQED